MRTINNYEELLDWFGASNYRELNRAVSKQLGRESTVVLYSGLDWLEREPSPGFEMTRFVVEAFDGEDRIFNDFPVPATEEHMAIGMVELEDPDKARAEGEEFLFMMGQVSYSMARRAELLAGTDEVRR